MKILAIADTEERCLWECFRKERFEGVDLILSAGDLDPDYLEFLVTVINKPLIYVRGNHDDRYARHAPGGCICVEDTVYVYRGVRIAGLGGSMRYRDGANMYSEREMAKRVRKLSHKIISPGVKMGEGWLLPAEMVELIEENVPNIVLTQPFGCLPNHIAGKGMIRKIREIYPESNIVSVDYDPGASEVNQLNRIKLMLSTAQKNLSEGKKDSRIG